MASSRRRTEMAKKGHKPEEIVAKLRQVDVLVSQGRSVADAIRGIGVTEVTDYSEGPQSPLNQGSVGQDPAIEGGVVHLQAALQEQLLDVAIAQGIAQGPGDGLQDQRRFVVATLEVAL